MYVIVAHYNQKEAYSSSSRCSNHRWPLILSGYRPALEIWILVEYYQKSVFKNSTLIIVKSNFEPIHNVLLCALSKFIRIQSSTIGPVWLHLALCTKLRLNHSISCLRERLFKVWISSPASTVSSCMCYSHSAVGAGRGRGHGPNRLVIPISNGGQIMATHHINSCPWIFRHSYGPVVSSAPQRKRNLPTFSTKMRYTKGPQIKQANRPTGLVQQRQLERGRPMYSSLGGSIAAASSLAL